MNRADRRKLEKTLIKSGKSKEEAKLLANSQKNPVMRIKKNDGEIIEIPFNNVNEITEEKIKELINKTLNKGEEE